MERAIERVLTATKQGFSPRPAFLLLGLVAACVIGCDRLPGESKTQKPSPPPPGEKVPNAPGPDNTIKEMPANPAPAEKAGEPREKPAEPPREGDR